MLKRIVYIVIAVFIFAVATPFYKNVEAVTNNATFDSFTYTETVLKDGTVKKTPVNVTFINTTGKKVTYPIDVNVRLYINQTLTSLDGFKSGMPVLFQRDLSKVTAIYGTSSSGGNTETINNKRSTTGFVTSIDPNGMYIMMKPDVGKETTYYLDKNTTYSKGNSPVDISAMYVGDRVKLTFKNLSTSVISEVSIVNEGVIIENLYKGTLQKVNTVNNTLTVKNNQPFTNWSFLTNNTKDIKTVSFQNTAPIYYGNTKITKNKLSQYIGNAFYYVTVKQFSKEIVKKIVVLANNERTYFEDMTSVDTKYNFINLASAGRIYFHNGSILIRNGRLVEPTALTAYGTAFVVADGLSRNNYAQVVQIMNDSLTSPNLASHSLYFGELSFVDGYLAEVSNVVKLENNYWKTVSDSVFSYSNSTVAVSNEANGKVTLSAYDDLIVYEGSYGYFYVKDDYITAVHLLDPTQPMGTELMTGSLTSVDATFPSYINAKNVNIWNNGTWLQTGDLLNMSIDQATIIKNGKVIDASQLKASDRVVVISNSRVNSHIILAD